MYLKLKAAKGTDRERVRGMSDEVHAAFNVDPDLRLSGKVFRKDAKVVLQRPQRSRDNYGSTPICLTGCGGNTKNDAILRGYMKGHEKEQHHR